MIGMRHCPAARGGERPDGRSHRTLARRAPPRRAGPPWGHRDLADEPDRWAAPGVRPEQPDRRHRSLGRPDSPRAVGRLFDLVRLPQQGQVTVHFGVWIPQLSAPGHARHHSVHDHPGRAARLRLGVGQRSRRVTLAGRRGKPSTLIADIGSRPLKTSQPRVRKRKRPLRPASGDCPGFL